MLEILIIKGWVRSVITFGGLGGSDCLSRDNFTNSEPSQSIGGTKKVISPRLVSMSQAHTHSSEITKQFRLLYTSRHGLIHLANGIANHHVMLV